MKRNYLLYKNEARDLIQEADVLLFRGQGFISKILMKAAGGEYSHVAIASWHHEENILECVEFREWIGGRTSALSHQIEQHNGLIDVYRPITPQISIKFNPISKKIEKVDLDLDKKAVTGKMREMTGLPYGWGRIWWLFKRNAIGLRLLFNRPTDDDLETQQKEIYPVCSTAIATAFSHSNFPLLKNRSDIAMEPSNISLSPRLQYLFTPIKDW